MTEFSFKDNHDFTQASFNQVARIVSSFGENVIFDGSASPNTEQCLEQLVRVASHWGYDSTDISILHDIFVEQNQRIKEYLDEIGAQNEY